MTEIHSDRKAADRLGRAWYTLDAVLLGGPALAYVGFFGAIHCPSAPGPFGGCRTAAGAGGPYGRDWRKYVPDRPRLWGLRLGAVRGIALYLIVPFPRFGWPPYKTQTRAFRQYVRARVDLDAMRTWLYTMDGKFDPNYRYDVYGTIEGWWPEAASWARPLNRLYPDHVRLALDDDRHPAIQIGGLKGCGLTVGSEQMRTPPADFSKREGYRLPVPPARMSGTRRDNGWGAVLMVRYNHA